MEYLGKIEGDISPTSIAFLSKIVQGSPVKTYWSRFRERPQGNSANLWVQLPPMNDYSLSLPENMYHPI
jgi:hypothetical protein